MGHIKPSCVSRLFTHQISKFHSLQQFKYQQYSNRALHHEANKAHFTLSQNQSRQLSLRYNSSNDKNDAEKKAESGYEKSFEDLLGQSKAKPIDKEHIEEQIRNRQRIEAEEKASFEANKAEFEKKKQQDFEDLLRGEKRRDEMSLQDLFKEYYQKAKTVDTKDYVNSAKSSLNSFSSLLEKRRQNA